MGNRQSIGRRSHKPGCGCRACGKGRKRLPAGNSIRADGAMFSLGLFHVDEGDYIGRKQQRDGPEPVYVNTSPPMPAMRKAPAGRACVVCGAILSRYNDNNQCQRHP